MSLIEKLLTQARQCRELSGRHQGSTAENLIKLARQFEAEAATLEAQEFARQAETGGR